MILFPRRAIFIICTKSQRNAVTQNDSYDDRVKSKKNNWVVITRQANFRKGFNGPKMNEDLEAKNLYT